jgi:competence protein ComEC
VRLLVLCASVALCAWLALTRAELGRLRAAAALALVAGCASALWHASSPAPSFKAHTTRLACTIIGDAAEENGNASFTCATDAGAKLAVSSRGALPRTGTRILVRGRIEAFDPPRNPGEPDERAIERERGIVARMSGARILRMLPGGSLTLDIALARAHAWALEQLRLRLPEPSATILAGELWGERASLPPELRAEFQETGTVHVLVTAGLHLGVVAALVLALLRALTVQRGLACALAIAAIWTYAIFSGLHLPACRAATMISFALTAYGFGRAARAWSMYGAALLAIALVDPQAVSSASFALSFSCVGAILLCADSIDTQLERCSALPTRLREALALTLATQLGTWPLTASIFLLFAPYAVFANAAVVPCVAATMILGALQHTLETLPQLAQAIANVNGWLLAWIVAVVHSIASLPAASLAAMPPPPWTIAVYDCLLIAAVVLWKKAARTAALAFFLFGAILVAWPPRVADHRLRITVLDVGQADAIVIRTPLGHSLMVDAGGRLEQGRGTASSAERIGERIVVPFLHREGIRTIDALLLSHPHGDHAGGVAPVLRALHVDEFADSGQRYAGFAYNDALAVARSKHMPMAYPRAGMVWRTNDGVTLTFIGPSLPLLTNTRNDINNNSLAFILQYRSFRMLFTGDAGAEAESRFLAEGIDLGAAVLKVGHHGSAYGSTPAFISAVHPRYAIISVGRHNMFGHPAPQTLDILQRLGAQIYRTDMNGAVTVTTDGLAIELHTMVR